MNSAEVLDFLQRHSDWLSHATFWRSIGHMILFWLLTVLYRIATFAEGLIDAVLLARGFLENERIAGIFEGMLIFSVSLTTLTLMIIAVRKLINPKVDLKAPVIRGLFTVALIGSMPGLLIRGLEVSVNAFEYTRVLGTEENTSISMAIIRENVADMHFIANHDRGFDILNESTSIKNTLNEDTIWHVDFSEVITPSDIGGNSSNTLYPLRYRVRMTSDGEIGVRRIRNGWFDLFDEGYFRWTANWGILYTTMPLIAIYMFCTAFMLLTTLLDLIFLKILVPILAPTDVETGQKMKHIAKDAGAAMLSIALIGVSLSVFRILLGLIFELDINFLARLVYLSVAVTVCMKGSSAFGKYLGVDIGMGSGMKSMLKLGAAGMLAAKATVGAGKLAHKGAKVVQNGVPKAIDGVKKVGDGAKNAVGTASESIGQMGAEFAGMGAKDFMKVKALNTKESLQDGLAELNPVPKIKSSFDENIGSKFKDGQASGDAKAIEGLSKLRNKEATTKRNDAMKAKAEKVKQHDPNAPLPSLGEKREARESQGGYQPNNKPINIFERDDISLSNGDQVSAPNLEMADTSNDSDSKYTLPQFGLNPLKDKPKHTSSNPFDKVQGVSGLNNIKPEKQTTPNKRQNKVASSPAKPVGMANNLNTKNTASTQSTPKIQATPMKVPTQNIGESSKPVMNAPRITSTQAPANIPKVTSGTPINTINTSGDDHDEK